VVLCGEELLDVLREHVVRETPSIVIEPFSTT
jgi:hypothetical protein